MFDYIKFPSEKFPKINFSKYKELVKEDLKNEEFQTKSLECCLTHYFFKKILNNYHLAYEQRPLKKGGRKKIVTVNGDHIINFYTIIEKENYDYWVEFSAIVTNGKLKKCKLVKIREDSSAERKASDKKFWEDIAKKSAFHKTRLGKIALFLDGIKEKFIIRPLLSLNEQVYKFLIRRLR